MQDLSRPTKPPQITAQNKGLVTILKGQAVAAHSSGTGIILANASTSSKNAIGLAGQSIAPSASGIVILSGPFTLSDWTAITGTVSLSALAVYYLDVTDGQLSTSPPSVAGSGNVVQFTGRSISVDTLDLLIDPAILL
jgi:hypothetical protein